MTAMGARSLKEQLVIAASAIMFIVQVLSTAFWVYTSSASSSAEFDKNSLLLTQQASLAMSSAVRDLDDIYIDEVLENLLEVPSVARVSVVSAIGEGGIERFADDLPNLNEIRVYSEPISIQEENTVLTLGVLDVTISTSDLKATQRGLAVQGAVLSLVILSLSILVLYFGFRHLFKPLEDLRSEMKAIDDGDFDRQIPSTDRSDVVGVLANALEGLRAREVELVVLRHATSEKAIRESMRIRHALHSTRDVVILVDETNEVVFRNASAKMFFPEFTIGDTLIKLKGMAKSRAELVRSSLFARETTNSEIAVVRHGAARYFQARTGAIVDHDGKDLGGLFLASDFTEQFEKSKEASYYASHDPLTGLLNRRRMDMTLADWSNSSSHLVGMLMIDLDHFKEINDEKGHLLGDALLIEVAKMLNEISSPDDLVIRLGGDEFAIISRASNCELHLDRIATTLIEKIAKPKLIAGQWLQISLSAGIATGATTGADWTSETLMRHADLALYQAKNLGRGRYQIYKNEVPISSLL